MKKLINLDKTNHLINCKFISPKSYASYILLKNDLIERSNDYVYYDIHNNGRLYKVLTKNYKRINFSRKFLTYMQEKLGVLECIYCGKNNLKIELGPRVRTNIKASIDHIIPVSKNGSLFDIENIVCACQICNQRKGNKLLEKYIDEKKLIDIKVKIQIFHKIAKTFKYDEY
jgi:5-methylcytosine-specific restriction endonuclease McrA